MSSFRPGVALGVAALLAACSGSDAATVATPTTIPSPADATIVERDDWGTVFDDAGVTGTFAARRIGAVETHVWNATRAAEPRLPASTFKILNSMIVLETGVVPDVDTLVRWDGVERELPEWNQDHSLRTGIEVSAVWMYQQLAREVGEERMSEAVRAADYGNADIGGGIDVFWLRGDLRISPIEQLDFLERMVTGDLPFDADVVSQVRDILVRERCGDSSWSHKTGTALATVPTLGWLVGTTRHAGAEWMFAMNLDLVDDGLAGQIDPQLRQRLSRELLVELGALPEAPC